MSDMEMFQPVNQFRVSPAFDPTQLTDGIELAISAAEHFGLLPGC
jgi:hypothetical protein